MQTAMHWLMPKASLFKTIPNNNNNNISEAQLAQHPTAKMNGRRGGGNRPRIPSHLHDTLEQDRLLERGELKERESTTATDGTDLTVESTVGRSNNSAVTPGTSYAKKKKEWPPIGGGEQSRRSSSDSSSDEEIDRLANNSSKFTYSQSDNDDESSDDESEDEHVTFDNVSSKRKSSRYDRSRARKKSRFSSDDKRMKVVAGNWMQMKSDYKKACQKIVELERKITVLRKAKSSKKKCLDPMIKQIKSELRSYMRYDFGRKLKFLPHGYGLWSDAKKSVCQLVVNAVQWPPDCSEDDKIAIWHTHLSKEVSPMLSEYKNKIHQPMRIAFNSKYSVFSCSHRIYCPGKAIRTSCENINVLLMT